MERFTKGTCMPQFSVLVLNKLSLLTVVAAVALMGCVMSPARQPEENRALEKITTSQNDPAPTVAKQTNQRQLQSYCVEQLKNMPGEFRSEHLENVCSEVAQFSSCQSVEGRPIFHYDKVGSHKTGQRILVLSLIHGDEIPSGSVARSWMGRLHEISPRNTWRVVPVLNPDGVLKKSRLNSRNVDLNRNFPTQDWYDLALKSWKEKTGSNPRRYPGPTAASEPETACAIDHIKDFKPDFIISIHTPLGVLDFDGPPSVPFPRFEPLPWRSLGHFPGSLGRYMWKEHGVPVLTVELKGNEVARRSLEAFDKLQDITGTVAIQAQQIIDQMGIEQKTPVFEPTTKQDVSMESTEPEEEAKN